MIYLFGRKKYTVNKEYQYIYQCPSAIECKVYTIKQCYITSYLLIKLFQYTISIQSLITSTIA